MGLGADIDARNVEAKTPLLVAAESGAEKAAMLLVAGGADVEAVDSRYRCTPLHWASYVTFEQRTM